MEAENQTRDQLETLRSREQASVRVRDRVL